MLSVVSLSLLSLSVYVPNVLFTHASSLLCQMDVFESDHQHVDDCHEKEAGIKIKVQCQRGYSPLPSTVSRVSE